MASDPPLTAPPPVWVLDTSVALKWFRPAEVHAPQARALRARYLRGEIRLAAPDLLLYEFANVLRYKGELTTRQVIAAVETLYDLEIEWLPASAVIMETAVRLAREWDVTIYDAVFASTAQVLAAPLVSADERLVRKMKGAAIHFLGDLDASQADSEAGS